MTALFKLSLRMYGRNWKRNLFNILSVTVAMLFIMSLLMLYINYERAQIENAYAYNGTWDFKITNASANMQLTADAIPDVISTALVNASLTAQLDLIEDKDRDGPSADIASHWLLSLIELGPGGSDAMSVSLIDGTWPSRSDEIVIPRDFIYAGKKHLSGDYQIGDTVELAVGKRLLPDQTPTQHAQLSNDESFDVIDTRSYRITGVLQGDYRRVGEFVVPGYIGTDDVFENQDNMTLYVQTHLKDSIGLQNIRYNLVETLGVDESAIEANEAITVAVSLIETSNVGKIYRSAGIALIVLLLILVGTIIVTSQAFNFQINEQAFSIMMVNGSGRLFVTLSLLLQNMFTFIISGSLAVILSISLTQFFSNYVSQLISEQGERYQFTAQIYVSYILLTLLLIAILVCVLPFFFTRRIDLRNLRSHAAGQSQYKHAKNMQIETDVPSWMRTYLRNKANFITLTISILISLLALSIGLVATSTIAAKTREVTDQFVADFYFLKLMNPGDPDDMDTIIDGLPDHVSALKYYANNVAFELPNHKMTPELRFFFGNTNDSVLLSSSVYSIDEDLFEFINGSKLTTFEEFSKDNIAIFFNRAKVAMDYSVNPSAETDQSGYIMLDDNQQSSQYIIIDMTTFEPGDRIVLSAVSGTPVSIDLPLAGTTNKYFGELFDNLPAGGVYVSERLFREIIAQDSYYSIMFVSTTNEQKDAMASYLQTAASKFNYFVQDNSQLTASVRISGSIQLTFIYAIMALAFIIALVNCSTIWGYEAYQQRHAVAVRRVFGQSQWQNAIYGFLSKFFILIIAAVLFLIIMIPLTSFKIELLTFYGINRLSMSIALVVSIIVHMIVILLFSYFSSRQHYRLDTAKILTKQ